MEFLNQFSAWLDDRVSSPKTISSYLQDLRIYMRWFEQVNGCFFSPELMNSTDVRHFRAHTLDVERRKPSTWNRRRASLAMFCSFCEQELQIPLFRMNRIPRAEEIAQAPRWLSEQDRRKLLRELEIQINAANTSQRKSRAIRDQAIIGLMVFAGLRISEVLDLKCMDVELSERKGSVTIQSGKGGTRRTVPMSTTLREMVQFYLQDRSGASEFLFSGEKDGNLTPRAVQKRVQQLETRLGIDGLFPHALRHTTAKSMLDGGAKLTQVQRIMGHKRIDTTTHYTMPSQEDLLEALELGEIGRGAK